MAYMGNCILHHSRIVVVDVQEMKVGKSNKDRLDKQKKYTYAE